MISKLEYEKYLLRIDELLVLTENSSSIDNEMYFEELEKITDLVTEYETKKEQVEASNLVRSIKYKMFELDLKQQDVARILGTSSSRVSEYLKGKREFTLKVAKALHKELGIEAEVILQ